MGNPNYNGSEIVTTSSGNVVLVNFNYRVGVLGFLASKNVRRDGDLNAGLLDQRQLLFWVQQHISQVGLYTPSSIPFWHLPNCHACFSLVEIPIMLSSKAPRLAEAP